MLNLSLSSMVLVLGLPGPMDQVSCVFSQIYFVPFSCCPKFVQMNQSFIIASLIVVWQIYEKLKMFLY